MRSGQDSTFPAVPAGWLDESLAAKWAKVREVRRAVTGALEVERAAKRIGSSLQAHPVVYIERPELRDAVAAVDFAEVAITSDIRSEEHTSELQSLMRISYAVFCLKKKNIKTK